MVQTKWQHHVAAYENAKCHTHVHLPACVRVCVDACMSCVCACVSMNNEISPFSTFLLSHYEDIPYIGTHSFNFSSCGTVFMFLFVQLAWRRVEHPIAQFYRDCR